MSMPLEEIEKMKGETVTVMLKDGSEIVGRLVSFDLNANAGIDRKGEVHFLQGVRSVRCKNQ